MVVFDDLSKGHEPAIPEGAKFVKGNLLDPGSIRDVLSEGFDGVLHFGGPLAGGRVGRAT